MSLLVCVCVYVIVSLSLVSHVVSIDDPDIAGSVDLTPEIFTQTVFSKPTFIKFFAPWCGHCQQLAPIWEQTARLIHREHPEIQLVGLDCTKYADICKKFGVRGFPTIKYVRPSLSDAELFSLSQSDPVASSSLVRAVYVYSGSRSELAMEQFVTQEKQWASATKEDYPLDPVSVPIILPLSLALRKEQQVQDKEGQIHAVAKTAASNSGSSLLLSASLSSLTPSSPTWMNVSLLVCLVLFVTLAVAYFTCLRGKLNPAKAL